MSRAVPIWFGKTDNTRVPDRVRLRIFERYNGRCQCGCYRKIVAGEAWQLDHKQALINGGPHAEDNLWPLLSEHHKGKTRQDVAQKSKTYRMGRRHAGIRKPRTIRAWRRFNGEKVFAGRER